MSSIGAILTRLIFLKQEVFSDVRITEVCQFLVDK